MSYLCKILHPATPGRCSAGYFRVTISGPELHSNNTCRDSSLAAENQEGLEKKGVVRPKERQSQHP